MNVVVTGAAADGKELAEQELIEHLRYLITSCDGDNDSPLTLEQGRSIDIVEASQQYVEWIKRHHGFSNLQLQKQWHAHHETGKESGSPSWVWQALCSIYIVRVRQLDHDEFIQVPSSSPDFADAGASPGTLGRQHRVLAGGEARGTSESASFNVSL